MSYEKRELVPIDSEQSARYGSDWLSIMLDAAQKTYSLHTINNRKVAEVEKDVIEERDKLRWKVDRARERVGPLNGTLVKVTYIDPVEEGYIGKISGINFNKIQFAIKPEDERRRIVNFGNLVVEREGLLVYVEPTIDLATSAPQSDY